MIRQQKIINEGVERKKDNDRRRYSGKTGISTQKSEAVPWWTILKEKIYKEKLDTERAQSLWESNSKEDLLEGLLYLIHEEAGMINEDLMSAGAVIIKDALEEYSVKDGKTLGSLLKKVNVETRTAAHSLDAPLSHESDNPLIDFVADQVAATTDIKLEEMNETIGSIRDTITKHAEALNGHIFHPEEKQEIANDVLLEIKQKGVLKELMAIKDAPWLLYMGGQWGPMAYTAKDDPLVITFAISKSDTVLKSFVDLLAAKMGTTARTEDEKYIVEFVDNQNKMIRLEIIGVNNSSKESNLLDIFGNNLLLGESHTGFIHQLTERIYAGLGDGASDVIIGYYENFLLGQRARFAKLADQEQTSDLKPFDRAMNADTFGIKENNLGGIDLTSDKNFETTHDGNDIQFTHDPAMLEQLKNSPGFIPEILSIQPMGNLNQFLNTPADAMGVLK